MGGTGGVFPSCKMGTFFLRSLALSMPIIYKFPIKWSYNWPSLKLWNLSFFRFVLIWKEVLQIIFWKQQHIPGLISYPHPTSHLYYQVRYPYFQLRRIELKCLFLGMVSNTMFKITIHGPLQTYYTEFFCHDLGISEFI